MPLAISGPAICLICLRRPEQPETGYHRAAPKIHENRCGNGDTDDPLATAEDDGQPASAKSVRSDFARQKN